MSKMAEATAAKYNKEPVCRGAVTMFPRALREVSKVSAYGRVKHKSPWNEKARYLDVPDAYDIYSDAMLRHIVEEAIEGAVNPRDDNLLHAAQVAWNALARLEWWLRDIEESAEKVLLEPKGSREPKFDPTRTEPWAGGDKV